MAYYSIDVECVATAKSHNARAVAQLSLVDQYEQVLLNLFVKPNLPVVSYLTPLTGLTKDVIDTHGLPFHEAVTTLKRYLPPSAVLVGQNIGKDVEWLSLKEGRDFHSLLDLMGLYRVWNSKYNSWSIFGQDHLAKVLLGWDTSGQSHDACMDAVKSMKLFNLYSSLQTNPASWAEAQAALLNTTPEPSFAKLHPVWEGVCMGNRKTCQCGAPFLG